MLVAWCLGRVRAERSGAGRKGTTQTQGRDGKESNVEKQGSERGSLVKTQCSSAGQSVGKEGDSV